jgi:septum formation protein
MSDPDKRIILGSGSRTRATMLTAAGIPFTVIKPPVDEDEIKRGLRAENFSPRQQADALAEVKAVRVSQKNRGFVIGADQMLVLGNDVFDKPVDREDARGTLMALRGKTHELITAQVIAKDGAPIWRQIKAAKLQVRNFSDAFMEHYLDALGDRAFDSVGAYQIEGLGAQIFSRIDGDVFTIQGMSLLEILAFLREHGCVEA